MTERDYAPLSIACVRGLCDKIYEKRKFAGVEIEKMVKDFNDANNTSQIKRLIRVLGQDLMSSTNPNVKNGALMGLSSVAVGLGKASVAYLPELIQPIIACFSEAESRVRYQAAEALFNVVKIARGATLQHFPLIFDALARLSADPEPQVKQAAELLDRLVKDIVTESPHFDVDAWVSLVRARLYSRSAGARQFLVSWVGVLDAGPAPRLLPRLPALLDPLLLLLADPHPEIRRLCDVQLNEFLRSVKKEPAAVDFRAMINVLITHAQSPEELLQLTSLTWLKEFLGLRGASVLPHAGGVLAAALPCLAYQDDARRNIRETAATVNFQLTKLVTSETKTISTPPPAPSGDVVSKDGANGDSLKDGVTRDEVTKDGANRDEVTKDGAQDDDTTARDEIEGKLDLDAVVGILTQLMHHNSVNTKVAALDWLLHLYNKLPSEMYPRTDALFPRAVGALTDASDDVVRRALALYAEICSAQPHDGSLESSPHYRRFLQALLRLLAADETLLLDRGAFIIRQLCVLLNAEHIYLALAGILREEPELRFVGSLVDVLGTLLLTAPELYPLRLRLRAFACPSSRALFRALYPCWCHAPVALLALCLLTHNYAHCSRLIATFGDLEITVDFLTEVDKLVQLIESPIFAYMRLELLSGPDSAGLRGALYGLLMLLPQSDAFRALTARLQAAPQEPLLSMAKPAPAPAPDIDFDSLLEEFHRVQDAHRDYRLRDRARARPRL